MWLACKFFSTFSSSHIVSTSITILYLFLLPRNSSRKSISLFSHILLHASIYLFQIFFSSPPKPKSIEILFFAEDSSRFIHRIYGFYALWYFLFRWFFFPRSICTWKCDKVLHMRILASGKEINWAFGSLSLDFDLMLQPSIIPLYSNTLRLSIFCIFFFLENMCFGIRSKRTVWKFSLRCIRWSSHDGKYILSRRCNLYRVNRFAKHKNVYVYSIVTYKRSIFIERVNCVNLHIWAQLVCLMYKGVREARKRKLVTSLGKSIFQVGNRCQIVYKASANSNLQSQTESKRPKQISTN